MKFISKKNEYVTSNYEVTVLKLYQYGKHN